MKKLIAFLALAMLVFSAQLSYATVATFDDNPLAPESNWGGAGSGETGFTSGNVYFSHTDSTNAWSGFVYSNRTDTTTAGYTNQFSAITGGGVNGSSNYGLSYVPIDWGSGSYEPIPQVISFSGDLFNTTISGAYFTNTTYSFLSMLEGDWVAKKFGGETGSDPDWFKLIIKGIDINGEYTDPIDFYLADFRFEDDSQDYILDEWAWMDLSSLGDIVGLEFIMASSDTGRWGMNTPAYFAIDDLNGEAPGGGAVPIPGAVWLLGSGLAGIAAWRRKTGN